ncbi:hypothetical protein OROGR_023152 [Orobanche gracilis]
MGRVHVTEIIMTCLLLASLFMVNVNASDENEVDDEHPFTYEENSERGPQHWGHLHPKWQTCETGHLQSPIDLLHARVELMSGPGDMKRTYRPSPAVIRNRGHDIMVQWTGDAGGLTINGREYKMIQCHWHTPSEHHVDGRRKLIPHLKSVGEVGKNLGVVNPWDLKFGSGKYYRYNGSITVPPCTEGVLWTVLKRVRTVSKEQLRALRDAVHDGFEDNARPTQSWDGRSVYMYDPEL